MSFNFEKLDVYHKAIEFIDYVYSATSNYPNEEIYGLTSQFRRSAVSISLNIAEGSSRTKKDFRRFLDIARGSVFECVTILQISKRRKLIDLVKFEELQVKLVEISKMLSGLKKSLTAKAMNNEQ